MSRTPGLAEIIASDWRKAARFYARFGITETQFWYGVSGSSLGDMGVNRTLECLRSVSERDTEVSGSQE